MSSSILQVERLYKTYHVKKERIQVLQNISINVENGEFITIVGHSGCGKSTLLRIIAGLESYDTGSVLRNGKPVKGPDTDCGMVFQDHRLLPWLTIAENVAFGIRHMEKSRREQLVRDHLALVKLEGFARAYPAQLSGGMSQRAAIARGLAVNPKLLLLDEPFGALDALTRIHMQKEILRIWEKEKTTMFMVTHDIDEAVFLGSRVVVMSARPGEIKAILPIDRSLSHDRGSTGFAQYRKKIYDYFFEDDEPTEDYRI